MQTNNTKNKKYKCGLVLSGGGARGFSHLGAAKALMEAGFKFDIIAGTSMGAIIGCLLADGYHPDELLPLLTRERLKSFVKAEITMDNVMTMKGAQQFLKTLLRAKKIEDLKIPFVATTTNLHKGETEYFDRGDVIEAVIASASIPVIFAPVKINDCLHVDGGVLNNLPVRHIRPDCEFIVGLHVNPHTLGLHKGNVKGLAQIAERTFHLAMLGNVLIDETLCNFFLEHSNLDQYNMFDFIKMKEIVAIGYENTKKKLAANPQLLDSLHVL